MGKKASPDALIQNAVWSVEHAAHKVKIAPDKPTLQKRMRTLRLAVKLLEARVSAELTAAPDRQLAAEGGAGT